MENHLLLTSSGGQEYLYFRVMFGLTNSCSNILYRHEQHLNTTLAYQHVEWLDQACRAMARSWSNSFHRPRPVVLTWSKWKIWYVFILYFRAFIIDNLVFENYLIIFPYQTTQVTNLPIFSFFLFLSILSVVFQSIHNRWFCCGKFIN